MIDISRLGPRLSTSGRHRLAAVPEGLDAMVLPALAGALAPRILVHVARDDQRLAAIAEQIAFFGPAVEILRFPAWDCLPYDRVSPAAEIGRAHV